MKYLDTSSSDFKKSLSSQIKSNSEPNDEISMVVSEIVKDIRDRGDEALLEYTNQYDRLSAQLKNLEITKSEIDTALSRISDSMRESLELSLIHISEPTRPY